MTKLTICTKNINCMWRKRPRGYKNIITRYW